MMKNTLKIVAISSLLSGLVYGVEITSASVAVNIAGKQRMYTQRMLKDYAMVGMGNTFGDPEAELKKTIESFNDHLHSLKAYAPDDEIKKSLDEVEKLWKPIEKVLEAKPQMEKVGPLQEELEKLLQASDKATKLFAKVSGKSSSQMVNIAGRQRMLSQRMASLYMLKVWGVEDPKFKTKLNDTLKLFKESMTKLEGAPLNNDESRKLLGNVKRSFMFFEMMSRSDSKFIPTLIYKKSDDILKNMDKVTSLYVANEAK